MNKAYYVYALQSAKDPRIYVGMSFHPQQRLEEHNAGRVTSTKAYRPWRTIYCKLVGDRALARAEEKRLKSGYGKEFLKNLDIPE